MTTYYKGNNIGLSYDAAAGTWSFNNTPQDFIDPNAFSTPDPKFPTAPTTPTTPTEPEQDPCPPGYIYDKALKQCVPDPNYQNPFKQDNQGGGQDDNTGTGLDPFNQAPQYKAGATGGASLVPTVDTDGAGNVVTKPGSAFDQSGIDYNIFNYGTYAPTRAQMNEHMLINFGIEKGWLSFDDEKNAYRKIQFQEQIDPTAREIIGNNWALNLLQKDAYRNYKDYFELLEKGHQPSSDENVWKKWIRGNAVYSLTGGMVFKDTSTRGGRQEDGSNVTYIGYSKDFRDKIDKAMSIKDEQGNVKGIIDRDGNVNVRADEQGGYYDSNGNYTGADGSKGSNLLKGMQYLINLQNSGIELPDNLKKRLFKGINSKALTPAQKATYASQLGYTSWNDVKKDLDTAVSNDDWWKKDDDGIIDIDDASSATDVNIDNISEDGTTYTPPGEEFYDDTYSPVDEEQGFGTGEASGVNQDNNNNTPDNNNNTPVVGPNPGDAGGSTSSGSSSSGNNYPNTPPPGTPSSPPSSAGEAFKRYGRF
jgi:hypothetical protein